MSNVRKVLGKDEYRQLVLPAVALGVVVLLVVLLVVVAAAKLCA